MPKYKANASARKRFSDADIACCSVIQDFGKNPRGDETKVIRVDGVIGIANRIDGYDHWMFTYAVKGE